jgi:hypothetical protein
VDRRRGGGEAAREWRGAEGWWSGGGSGEGVVEAEAERSEEVEGHGCLPARCSTVWPRSAVRYARRDG